MQKNSKRKKLNMLIGIVLMMSVLTYQKSQGVENQVTISAFVVQEISSKQEINQALSQSTTTIKSEKYITTIVFD